MRKTLVYLAIGVSLAACHRGSGDSLQREQQQYDVVQEGQTSSGVTSTINAPGEPMPPTTGMTGTNADTTSNFTLPPLSSTGMTSTQPGTIAGTMTVPSNRGPMLGYPSAPPRPRPRRPRVEPPPTNTTGTNVPPPAPPATSTLPPTTDTAPPPPPRDDQKPPPTDTQPPPSTTTTGP